MPSPYPLDLTGRRAHYDTTLDRAGLALAAGGGLIGLVAAILTAADPGEGWVGVALAFPLGLLIGTIGIVAVGGLPWLVLHAIGRRGPGLAVALGALLGFLLCLAAQTGGFGATLAPADAQTLLFRWLSAALTSAVMALLGAAVAVVMWRVGYRRVV